MLSVVKPGKRLQILMTVAERGQEDVAKRAGVSVGTVSNMMRGKVRARPENLEAVAGALGVPLAALEDDVACIREIARMAGVTGMRVGEPATVRGELAELLASVPADRASSVASMLRGMLGLMAPPATAAVEAERDPPRQRAPSPDRPTAGEGDDRRR